MSQHRIDYGGFCVWQYNGPTKKARAFWHGDNPLVQPIWAYALRSRDGSFWETSRAKGGFLDQDAAVSAARNALAERAS